MATAMPVAATTRASRRHEAKLRRDAARARYGTQVNVSDPEGDRCCCCKATVARMIVNLLLVVSQEGLATGSLPCFREETDLAFYATHWLCNAVRDFGPEKVILHSSWAYTICSCLAAEAQACGVCVLVLGIWATSGRIGAIFGAYPGLGLIVVAAILVVTALLGEYGSRADNKCLLLVVSVVAELPVLSLASACVYQQDGVQECMSFYGVGGDYMAQYFLVIFVGFAVFLISGISVLAGGPSGDSSVASGWCSFPESAARAQETFGCCGLSCPSDLPAQGLCPGGVAFNGTLPKCIAENSNAAVCDLPLASRPVNSSLPGCKRLAVTYVQERIVPLFAAALTVGLLLLAGMIVACKLLCKRSRPRGSADHGGKAMSEAVGLNSARGADDGWIDTSGMDSGAGVSPAGPKSLHMAGTAHASAAGAEEPGVASSDVAAAVRAAPSHDHGSPPHPPAGRV